MEMIEKILVVAIFAFILVITILSNFEIKKRHTGLGYTILLVEIVVLCVVGIVYGNRSITWILMLLSLITERLLLYRASRPDDKLSRFLAKLNW